MARKHDPLFKYTFSKPAQAASALQSILPTEIVTVADWSTLTVLPGSFVTKELRHRHSDLLYSVEVRGQRTLIHVIFEHQSSVDPLMPLRVLEYVVCAWRAQLEETPGLKRLPPIVPVVLYNGTRVWTAPKTLSGMYALDPETLASIRAWLPEASFVLQDLARTDDELLATGFQAVVGFIFGSLKHSWAPEELFDWFTRSFELIQRVTQAKGGMEVLGVVFEYALSADVPLEQLKPMATRLGQDAQEVLMTAADRLIEQGRVEGRAEGLAEGVELGLAKAQRGFFEQLLRMRFGQLDDDVLVMVRELDDARIEALHLELLDPEFEAESIGAFLKEPADVDAEPSVDED